MAVPESSTSVSNKTVAELQIERTKFTDALMAVNTQRGYGFDQRAFRAWGARMGLTTLPAAPDTLSLFVTSMLVRGLKVSSCARRVAAVAHQHRSLDLPSPAGPELQALLLGARRLRIEQVDQALPLTVEEIRAIAVKLLADDSLLSIRNWTIVLIGFCAALRNSNTAALQLSDVEFSERGAILKIRKSKTDQIGKGRLIGLPFGKHPETCPATALKKWIARRGDFPGPLFPRLNGHGPKERALRPPRIGEIVQQCIRRIGLDSRLYSGHSLRAGFCTEAGECGAGELLIAAQTGHSDMEVLRQYFRRRDVFARNALILMDL